MIKSNDMLTLGKKIKASPKNRLGLRKDLTEDQFCTKTVVAALLVCSIACVGCQPEPSAGTPAEELTVSELEELIRKKKNAEELTVSELEELIRKKKNNTTKPLPADNVTETLSSEKKDGSYSLKAPPNKHPQSKVSSDGRTFDWGSAMQGEVVTHDFEIRNSGITPLIIKDVKPACGCTTVGGKEQVIAPGATGKITLSVDTLRFTGRIKKTAQVITNAGKSDKTTLTMQGEIEVVIVQDPPPGQRGLTKVSGVPIKPRTIALSKGTEKTFTINRVSCVNRLAGRGSPPLVNLELLEIEEGSHYELVVTPQLPLVLENTRTKYYTANIIANVTVEGKTFDLRLDVPIGVKKRVVVDQKAVYFSKMDLEKLGKPGVDPATKEVVIRSLHPDHSFNIVGVRVQGEHIKAHLKTVIPGKEYKLAIDLAKKPEATGTSKIVENILIDTDDDDPTLQEFTIEAILHRLTLREARKKVPLRTDSNGSKEPAKNNPSPATTGGSS